MIKRTLSTFALLLFILGVGSLSAPSVYAQGMQAGYIFEQALIVNMPEYQEVQQQLQQEAQGRQQQMQQQMQQLQQKMQSYQKQQSLLSEEKRAQREQELRQLQQELQEQRQQQQQALMEKEQELMQPLYERLNTALETVSEEQGLDLVFRGQALAQASDNVVNVTPAVAQQLGIEVPEAPEPGATPDAEAPTTSPLGGGQ